MPVFNPATKELITRGVLDALFPLLLIEQEVTMKRHVPTLFTQSLMKPSFRGKRAKSASSSSTSLGTGFWTFLLMTNICIME